MKNCSSKVEHFPKIIDINVIASLFLFMSFVNERIFIFSTNYSYSVFKVYLYINLPPYIETLLSSSQ